MSATSATPSELTEKQQRILQYLRREAQHQMYFKSRLIAEELDLSAKEVGANMGALRGGDLGIEIEKWGYSSGTTWKVSA